MSLIIYFAEIDKENCMAFELKEIEKLNLNKFEFHNLYRHPKKPVVFKNFASDWDASKLWTPEYLKDKVGKKKVGIYDNSKVTAEKKVNEPDLEMYFHEYMDLIQKEPTDLRIFAFNIFNEVPELMDDFEYPDIDKNLLKKWPMMFFGGKGSAVFAHYDIDWPNLYHTHFNGRKLVYLFPNEYSTQLYKLPFAIHNIEDIDMENPDLEKYPALEGVKGYKTILEHGETLYIPSGYWHYLKYLDGSWSLTLRAVDTNIFNKAKGLYNLIVMRNLDNLFRKLGGQKWLDYKERKAMERAHKYLKFR